MKMDAKLCRLLCATAAFMPLIAAATENDDEFSVEFPVVLSASRLKQSLQTAPSAVSVIDQATIIASGARTIPELLRLVPGFLVTYINGNTPSVTNGGLGDGYSRQMQVLIDGRSVYSPLWGGLYWADLPLVLEDVERIEVVRGPNAETFGANSFLGVINIVTKETVAEDGNSLSAIVGKSNRLAIRHNGKSGMTTYRLSMAHDVDPGFDQVDDAQKSDILNGRIDIQINPVDSIQAQLGALNGTRGQSLFISRIAFPYERQVNSGFIQARWTRREDSSNEMWLQFLHDQRDTREILRSDVLRAFGVDQVDLSNKTRRNDVEFQQTASFSTASKAIWGGELRQDQAWFPYLLGVNSWKKSSLQRLFSHWEWSGIDNLTLNLGAMYERTDLTKGRVSPRIAANWEFYPEHYLRASWTAAERTPTIGEKYGVANSDDLSSEKVSSSELAYLGSFPEQKLSLQTRIYASRIRDLIGFKSFVYAKNIDDAYLKGVELSFKWQPWQGSQVDFSWAGMKMSSSSPDAAGIVAATPDHTMSLLFQQALGDDWTLGCTWSEVATMQWGGGADPQPAFNKLDVRVAKTFSWGNGQKLVAAIVTENAQKSVMDYYTINHPVRTTTLRLDYSF